MCRIFGIYLSIYSSLRLTLYASISIDKATGTFTFVSFSDGNSSGTAGRQFQTLKLFFNIE